MGKTIRKKVKESLKKRNKSFLKILLATPIRSNEAEEIMDMAKYKPETAGLNEANIRAFVTELAEEMAKYKLETAGLDKVFSEAFITALSEGKLKQHLLSEEGKKDLYIIGGAIIVCGVAGPLIVTNGLSMVGFGSAGVKAGSVAAVIQSGIGNVPAGSLFSIMQSVGAAGLAKSTTAAITGFSAVLGGAATWWTQ